MKEEITIKDVRERLDNCIDLYLDFFCKKHDVFHSGWVGGVKGGIIEISDAYFNFEDIAMDLDLDASEEEGNSIWDWYWSNIESGKTINYYSYLKGLRVCKI